jgi:isoleucyl-tRNA synthetase
VWTTTPWTLPANVAVAAGADVEYVTIERSLLEGGTEKLILAEALLEKVFRGEQVRVVDHFKGKKLRGTKYLPLFTFMPLEKPAHYVVLGDFVTTEDGTGLVHIAPAFGADDMEVAKVHDLPVLMTVGPNGAFISAITPWRGIFVKDADPAISADLEKRGLVFRLEKYTHTYPFCWRCDTPLLYYARESWYIRTSAFKERLVELNRQINWVPEHIREGRFGNWLENNIDWSLSRERYWGTPLPIWVCLDCGQKECVGSVKELSEKTSRDQSSLDLHRPYVDNIYWNCAKCGGKMTRVLDLIDVWFDSGSMPVSQWHYPFENKDKFESQFPADFIAEAVDQTRGWFYTLHAISTLLFDKPSFKNVLCLGLVVDENGQKMSKSRGNDIDPWKVLNDSGADAFRWYFYTSAPPNAERRFAPSMVSDVIKNFTLMLWNVYSFFVTYANLDQPDLTKKITPSNDLDKWLLSALNALIQDVTKAYETYDVPGATRPIESFVEVLSTWYLRRSRRRFWKSGSDDDKKAAYHTLYTTLVTLAKLLAPAMPFLADEMYQNLVRSVDPKSPESVHLATWPVVDASLIDEAINREMALVMRLVSLGHSARQKANRKVRQPLAEAAFALGRADERHAIETYAELITDELNVKRVRLLNASTEAATFSLKPLPKQLGQKYGNKFPGLQKTILGMDATASASVLLSGQPLKVSLDGESYDILPEEVEVRADARSGFAVASDGPYLAALVTDLTPELIQEGFVREFVRRVQELRKTANLDVVDRILLYVTATPGLREAIKTFSDYVNTETLTRELKFEPMPSSAINTVDEFDGETVSIGIMKA